MKRLAAALLLSLAAAGAQAHPHDDDARHLECEVRSDYTMRMHGKAFVFESDRDAARHIALGGGRLFVNGEEVKLTPADRERLRRYEAELNRMVPRIQHVVTEATDIAFSALTEVARGFATDGGQVALAKLERARREVRADLARQPILLNEDDIGDRVIAPLIREHVPVIAGNAVRSSLAAAFSGDEREMRDFERRMERMGRDIERKVEKRAEALEPQIEALCDSVRELDRIEDGLALRLEDGEPIALLHASR